MNKFELFTLIYYVLDAYYEDASNTDDKINTVISDMNPFMWQDCISADPAVYDTFCKFVGDRKILLENSLQIAREYIDTIDYADVSEAFQDMTDEEWIEACKEFLANEHKGQEAPADIDISQMTEVQLHAKLQRGYDDYKTGKTQAAAEAFDGSRKSQS